MKWFVSVLMVTGVVVAMAAAPALAQVQPSPTRPGAPPAAPPPAEKKTHSVDGTVKKVDPAAKTVDVSSGMMGMRGAKLQLAEDTKIQINGKDATIAEIKEGAKVTATYESQDGKNVAKLIEVKPAEEKAPAASPPTAPGTRPTPSTPGGAGPKTQ